LGVKIDCSPAASVKCLDACGLAFFFAPAYHAAMRHAGPARREVGVRTILNLLGPLANPAGTMRQLIGVGAPQLTETFARVLAELGAEHVMVVHGSDGLDEITLTGPTRVSECRGNRITTRELRPEEFGLKVCRLEDLQAEASAEARAEIVRGILDGRPGPRRTITELNAAAALIVGGRVNGFENGLKKAAEAIDSGAARRVLQTLVEVSNRGEAA
jgi:anthranilate phosphoribosyltransferase